MKLLISIFLAAVLSVLPLVGAVPQPDEGIRLNVSLISDPHIRKGDIISKGILEKGLRAMGKDKAECDALLIAGDLTELAKEEEFDTFFQVVKDNSPTDNWIFALGNHDTTRAVDFSIEKAKSLFLQGYNENNAVELESCYYSIDVKGYTFVVMVDERTDDDASVFISDGQFAFLDRELQRGTKDGKPVFVVCHYPLSGANGQEKIDLVTFDDEGSAKVRSILEKYENVFMITGHLHTGINGGAGDSVRGFSQLETINGVTYISLPAFGSLNLYGIVWPGNGYRMEVYDNEIIFRARNYVTGKWYSFSDFTVELA